MYRKGGSIFPNGLDDLLRNSSDGKIVLIRKNNLDNACRQKLVKIIVDYLLNQNNRKHKFPSVLKEAAEEIIKLFPDERIESYYIPYSRQSNVKVCAKGKLYSKWLNSRRALQLAQRPPVTDTEKPASPEITTDEIRNYNQLVQFSLTSFDDCLGIWNNTFQIRMSKLKEFEDPIKYFNHFGVLKQSFGYKLLIEDFNIKYPEAKDVSIHSIWPKISSIIKDTLIRNKHADLLLTMNFPDYQLQSLRALAWMFRPVVLRNKIANKSTKISRTEMADCFITIVETFEELELKIVERREKLKQYDFIFKPFMAAVISPAKVNYLVIIEQQRYTFTDSLHALDALFKIFIALDIPYPLETKVMWQFIDQLVYKISKVVDPGASTVLSEIERYLHIKTEV